MIIALSLSRTHMATYEKFEDGKSKDISDELPFDLPQGWAWCRIRDVTVLRRGEYVTKKLMNPGNIPVILGGQEPAYYCDRSNHDGQCVVISRSGASAGFASYWNQPIFVTDGFLFECPNGISTRFLYHWFKSFPLVKLQRGTGMPHVQSENLNALLFALPPSVEQQRIVEKIEELFACADAIGESSEEIAKTAQRIDKKILDLAIRGQLVPQDPSDEPASELVKRIEAAKRVNAGGRVSSRAASDRPAYEIDPPFDIPNSWEWVSLGEICSAISKGSTPKGGSKAYTASGVLFIRAENVCSDGNLRTETAKYIHEQIHCHELGRSILEEGDLLITIAGSLGRSAIVSSDVLPANTNQAVAFARPCDKELSPYLKLAIMSGVVQSMLLSQKKVTGIPNLTLEIVSNLRVPLPPLAEQKRIVAKIEELRAMTKSLTT